MLNAYARSPAERRVAALTSEANFNREILRYLNRLSDAC
jgi:cob(I)alamin adenosyltransferase